MACNSVQTVSNSIWSSKHALCACSWVFDTLMCYLLKILLILQQIILLYSLVRIQSSRSPLFTVDEQSVLGHYLTSSLSPFQNCVNFIQSKIMISKPSCRHFLSLLLFWFLLQEECSKQNITQNGWLTTLVLFFVYYFTYVFVFPVVRHCVVLSLGAEDPLTFIYFCIMTVIGHYWWFFFSL